MSIIDVVKNPAGTPGSVTLSEERLGGDLASTWVAKPEVHAEGQKTS
jgi:hypothetical protein